MCAPRARRQAEVRHVLASFAPADGAMWSRLATSFAESLLPPFPYCLGVLRVVAVRVEPEAATEARIAVICFGRAPDEVDEVAVSVFQLPQHLRERKASLLLRHLRVEGVDAAIPHVPRGASCRVYVR